MTILLYILKKDSDKLLNLLRVYMKQQNEHDLPRMQKAVDENSYMYLRYRIDGKHSSKYLGTVDSTVYAEYLSRRELKL